MDGYRGPHRVNDQPLVVVRDGEVEHAIKLFKKRMLAAGVFKDMRRHEFYEKPSVRRRKKYIDAQKRQRKNMKQAGVLTMTRMAELDRQGAA